MSVGVVEVVAAGPMVTIQDVGRPGLLRYGIPRSGPMDRLGHAAANVACGAAIDAAAVEVSEGGVELQVDTTLTIGFTSAAVAVSGQGLEPSWGVVTLAPGSTLSVRPAIGRRWAYLAVSGTLAVPRWLGSSSTLGHAGLGGAALVAGTRLEATEPVVRADLDGPIADPHDTTGDRPIRVVLGPQVDAFVPAAADALVSVPFAIGAGDRMGVRLDGPTLALADALTIPSEPIVRGSVQVAGDGVPTVLLADHQTTGGYPKIATVVSVDTDLIAQRPRGAEVRFTAVGAAEAIAAVRAEAAERRHLLAALAASDRTLAQRLAAHNLHPGPDLPD